MRRIYATKLYALPPRLDELVAQWKQIGLNTLFTTPEVAGQPEYRALAKKNGLDTFLIVPVFFEPGAATSGALQSTVDSDGHRVQEDWVEFVSPSCSAHLHTKYQQIDQLLRELRPEALSLDFVRYHCYWEQVGPTARAQELRKTCFSPDSLSDFSKHQGIVLPATLSSTAQISRWMLEHHAAEFSRFKQATITNVVKTIAARVRDQAPATKLCLHLVPWRQQDYDGAMKTVVGQNVTALGECVDLLTPMTYHFMVRRDPSWIRRVLEDLEEQTPTPLLPSVQVSRTYRGDELPLEEFEEATSIALRTSAAGLVFYNWEKLAASPERRRIAQRCIRYDQEVTPATRFSSFGDKAPSIRSRSTIEGR